MEELLSIGERKELELFSFILNSDRFIPTTILSELIGYSISNTWRIINKLADTYPDHIVLVKNKQLGVRFVELNPNQDTYLQIKIDYFKKNLNYILLDSLFNEYYSSIQEFCEAHFISITTFYTKKKELDILLSQNKLTVDTKNFRILSFNDMYVREFYYHFYWEAFRTIIWPFKTIEKQTIEVVLDLFIEHTHIEISKVEKEQILYRLATTVIRIKNYHIFDSLILHNLISPELKMFLSTQTSWLKELVKSEDEYTHENNYLAFLVISNYSSAYVNFPIADDYLVNHFTSFYSTEWMLTLNFFDQLNILFPNQSFDFKKNLPDLLHIMYTHIYSSFFASSYIPTLIKQNILNISPLCQEMGEKIIASIDQKTNPQNIYYLKYYYSLFVEKYIKFEKVNILLYLSSDRMSTDLFKNRLLTTLSEYISIIEISEQNSMRIDLVISDTRFETSAEVFFSRQPNSEQVFKLLTESILKVFFRLNQ